MTKRIKSERTGIDFWLQRGFTLPEARAFSNTSYDAIYGKGGKDKGSPVLKHMIGDRVRLLKFAQHWNWTPEKFKARIKAKYDKMGITSYHGSGEFLGDDLGGQYMAHDYHDMYKSMYNYIDPKTGKVKYPERMKIKELPNDASTMQILSVYYNMQNDTQFKLSKAKSDDQRATLRNKLNNIMIKISQLEGKL